MKVAILAGGLGSRLSEETESRPKPLVEIGGRPILWHIMKIYASQGLADFVIALGYKGELIKRYFIDYWWLHGNLTLRGQDGRVEREPTGDLETWTVRLIDTGQDTATGGRIRLLAPHLDDDTFMLTWGDGVSNIDLARLVAFHRAHGRLATVTAVRPPTRFGLLELDGDRVARFCEKPQLGEGWINGAFFVLEPGIFEYIDGPATQWELEPMERLARDGELMAYKHEGYWQCMDTLRDKRLLEECWDRGNPPWKLWY